MTRAGSWLSVVGLSALTWAMVGLALYGAVAALIALMP